MQQPGANNRPAKEHSLYTRLLLALIATICLVCLAQLCLSIYEGRKWVDESLQRVNWELAGEWAHEIQLRSGGAARLTDVNDYLTQFQTFDPTLRVYVLSKKGDVLHSFPSSAPLIRGKVAVEPLEVAQLLRLPKMPLYGDDPATHADTAVFSISPLELTDQTGYLYIIIDNPASKLISSRDGIEQMAIFLLPSFLVVTFGGGVILWLLTVYLSMNFKKLIETARHFEAGRYTERIPVDTDDEIGYLARSFNKMAASIVDKEHELKRVERERRAMVANIAHDLRTPLTSIQGFLQTILLRGEQIDNDQRKRFLSIIERSSERQRQLLENLSALSGLDAREQKPEKKMLPLTGLVQDVAASFEQVAQEKSIAFCCETDGLPHTVRADKQMLERVVANLISNAIKYTPDGGEVRVRVDSADGNARVSVVDTGVGIPESDLPQIFDDFYRVKREGYDNPGGTGLGLAIVRRMIELHGSKMQVVSAEGKGTTFWFELESSDAKASRGGRILEDVRPVDVVESYSAMPSILRSTDPNAAAEQKGRLEGVLPDLLTVIGTFWVLGIGIAAGKGLLALGWSIALYALIAFRIGAQRAGRKWRYTFLTAVISFACGSTVFLFLSASPDFTYPLIPAAAVLYPATALLLFRRSLLDMIAGVIPASAVIIERFYSVPRYELYLAGVLSGLLMSGVLILAFALKRNKKLDRRFHLVFVVFVSAFGSFQVFQSTVYWRILLLETDQQELERVARVTFPAVKAAVEHSPESPHLHELLGRMAELSPRIGLMIYDPEGHLVVSKVAMHGRGEGILTRVVEFDRIMEEVVHIKRYTFGYRKPIPPSMVLNEIDTEKGKYSYAVGTNPLYKVAKRKVEETSAGIMIIWVCVVTLLCGFVLRVSSKRYVIDRLAQLVEVMQRIDKGDLAARLPRTVGDEIDRMGKTLNQMADTIARKIDALRFSDQQRRLLIRAIAETLKEPLSEMQGSVNQMIAANAELELETLQRYSQDVQKAVRAQYHLVEDLFEFSKLEVDELKPNPEPIVIGELVHDATLQIEEKLDSKGISLEFDIQDPMPFVSGDIGMLSKALEVLIEYAVLRTPTGSSLRVRCAASASGVEVRISDGQGQYPPVDIVKDDISFVARTEGISYSVDCNPLRLTLARRFIELHSSRLTVEFALGQGGTYGFTLATDGTIRAAEYEAKPASIEMPL